MAFTSEAIIQNKRHACGGHNPPVLMRLETGETHLLEETGPILGILPDACYTDIEIPLQPGDILTLYTDGVSEQENENSEEFSVDRLKQVILSHETEPAAAVVSDITQAVFELAGTKEQADDLTAVVVKIL